MKTKTKWALQASLYTQTLYGWNPETSYVVVPFNSPLSHFLLLITIAHVLYNRMSLLLLSVVFYTYSLYLRAKFRILLNY